MENSSGLLNALVPPALMVLASTSESPSSTTTLCQQVQTFAVPVTMDKAQVPFLSPSYTLAPMYHQAEGSGVDYPPPLLHLHPQFGVLGYGPVPSFPPFQEIERFRPAYPGPRSLKQLQSVEPPQIRYLTSERDFKKYRAHLSTSSGATGKRNAAGALGMASDSDTPWKSSQQARSKSVKAVHDCCVFLRCPLCQEALKRGDVQQHLQQELERLATLNISHQEELPKDITSLQPVPSPSIKEEVETPSGSPLPIDHGHHSERQQTFQQVKINRESRLNARAKRCKRTRPSDEEQIAGLFSKDPRFPDVEEESFTGNHYVEYTWQGLSRSSTQTLLGLKGSNSRPILGLTSKDSDGDPETDVDELPIFSKFKCSTVETLEGHSLKSTEGLDKGNAVMRTLSSDEEEGVTWEILKTRISELTQRLRRRETYRCHVCMGSYCIPLASIQCWHIHCEECWLRKLGSKKLCPQCNTITSPRDLRRIFL